MSARAMRTTQIENAIEGLKRLQLILDSLQSPVADKIKKLCEDDINNAIVALEIIGGIK